MSILSNKLELEFNRENIDRDFDIYMVSKESGYYFKTNVLDRALIEHKARSVVYVRGSRWYVMFAKNELDYSKFKELLEEEDPDSTINKLDVLKEDSMYKNVLAQLLFNTLAAPTREDMMFNNICGKLYYTRPSYMERMPKTFYALEVRLTYTCFLTLKVKTFSCVENIRGRAKGARFLFDEKSGRFRKQLKGDNVSDSKLYVEKSFKKNTVSFLDFSNYKEFCDSRVGVYVEFMQDVKECLSEYITISVGGYDEYENFSVECNDFENQDYGTLLNKKGVCVIDMVDDEKSRLLLEQIRKELKDFYGVDCYCNRYLEGAYTIRIIHNEEYYEKHELPDPHQSAKYDEIVQHATIENFKLKAGDKVDAALKKVVQELIIKGDIFDRKLTTVKWNVTDKPIKFVKAKSYWREGKDRNVKEYNYYRMTILPSGEFELDTYDSADFTEDEEWNVIHETYKKHDDDWKDRDVEGIVYYDYANMNVIMRTEQTTLPNLFKLGEALKLSDKENMVNAAVVKEVLDEFRQEYPKDADLEEIKVLDSLLSNYGLEDVKIGTILHEVSIRKKGIKNFNSYLFQTRGILLHMTPKAEGIKEDYFESVLDIKYFYHGDKLYYFVGTKDKALQQSINNACILREVITTGDEIFMQDLFQLLAVEFVRNGQYTVVPFPFKYLNEVMEKMK